MKRSQLSNARSMKHIFVILLWLNTLDKRVSSFMHNKRFTRNSILQCPPLQRPDKPRSKCLPWERNKIEPPSLGYPSSKLSSSCISEFVSKQLIGASGGCLNFLAAFTGFGILIGYHIKLIAREKQGEKTWRITQAETREKWAQFVRETEGWLYAIQTLRNAITANTFLSTTVLSLLTVITGRLWDIIRSMDAGMTRRYLIGQFTIVACCMLVSAYHFLQSARLMTHAGFMFPVESKETSKVDNVMRKSQNGQWLGLRWLYVSLGMISWVVGGPKVLFCSSLVLIFFFQRIDNPPDCVE